MAQFAIEGFGAIAQDHISRNVASNFYPKLPWLSALAFFTLTRNGKTALNIGRPDGEILTGKTVSPAETMSLDSFNAYKPRIQRFETANSKWMGKYDTTPVVANPTTSAHSQATQATADFRRARLKTPILVWHSDKDRALQKESKVGQGIEMSRLIDEATEVAYQEHVKELNDKLWNGNPTSQAADPWDQPLGLLEAMKTTNTYGNVDRNGLDANSAWLPKRDTAFTTPDIQKILDDANLVKRIRVNGPGTGIDLVTTTVDLYQVFKAQVQAKQGCRVLTGGLPGMTSMGQTQEAIQVDNAFVIYDPSCPANTVVCNTMASWRAAIAPGKNLNVSKFTDLSDKSEGAKEADQAFIETELIFACDNPGLNAIYTAIGT